MKVEPAALKMVQRSGLQVCLLVTLLLLWILYFFLSPVDLSKRVRNSAKPEGNGSLLLPPRGPCTCYPGSEILRDYIPMEEYKEVEERRSQEFQKDKLRKPSILSRPLLAPPNSPLQYPIQGFTVRPLTPTLIPGLGLYAEGRTSYQVTLKVSIGVLTTEVSGDEATVTGSGSTELTLKSNSLMILNFLLATIFYTSTVYHVNTGDLASFRFEEYEAVFPVDIKQPPVPILWDMGKGINSQVTITIKTFMRYTRLNILLDSIRQFYPKIPIIIADDSFEREAVKGENIQQYFMPPGKGWFAGRNLAVSQVTTKYFLWVDDDYMFTRKTKIEKFVEVMEANPQLDVVGGSVQGHRFYFSIHYEEGEESDGGCMHLDFERMYQSLPGFPHCSMVNGVVNFFLARTDAIQKAGFDPKFQRIGHPEVFMDGLGKLIVATCDDTLSMHIDHQPHGKNSDSYKMFRINPTYNTDYRFPIFFFKHNLKCIKFR